MSKTADVPTWLLVALLLAAVLAFAVAPLIIGWPWESASGCVEGHTPLTDAACFR